MDEVSPGDRGGKFHMCSGKAHLLTRLECVCKTKFTGVSELRLGEAATPFSLTFH